MRQCRSQSGQVATFFALSFVMFMVFLALLINTGFLSRDRIKIQNNADLAALVGAQVQRFNLNTVGELNDKIDTAYKVLQTTLANPITASPCVMRFTTCNQAGMACNQFCSNLDAAYAAALAGSYSAAQAQYAGQIMTIITQANSKAYHYAKQTALHTANLPLDVKRRLLRKNGVALPAERMVEMYDRGELQDDYDLDGTSESLAQIYKISANDQQPLFMPEPTSKIVFRYRRFYNPCGTPFAQGGGTEPCALPITQSTGVPLPLVVAHKIIDRGDITPSFITAVSYSPQYLINKTPLRALPDAATPWQPGEIATAPGSQQSAYLFDVVSGRVPFATQVGARQFMSAWSAARPYGGAADRGGYDGAKLIGLASKSLGEVVHDFGIAQQLGDEQGQSQHQLTERDFLH